MEIRKNIVEVGDFGHTTEITHYIAFDGSEFTNEQDCKDYEFKKAIEIKFMEISVSKNFNFMDSPIPQITKLFYNQKLLDAYLKTQKIGIHIKDNFAEGEVCFLVYKLERGHMKNFVFGGYELWKEEYTKKYFEQIVVLKDLIY